MFSVINRYSVPTETIEMLRPHLEITEDPVKVAGGWGRTEMTLSRYTIIGVPGKRIDVTMCRVENLTNEKGEWTLCCEIGIKTGRYDGAERLRLCLRPWFAGRRQPLQSAEISVKTTPTSITIAIDTGNVMGNWSQTFDRLRSDMSDYNCARIVVWHWNRYYQFLPPEEVHQLADSIELRCPTIRTGTLAEANRMASRELYRLARDLGWRKLCTRERKRYGIDSMWVRADKIAQADQSGHPSGCGEFTLEAANVFTPHG